MIDWRRRDYRMAGTTALTTVPLLRPPSMRTSGAITRAVCLLAGILSVAGSRASAQIVEAGVARDARLGTPLECLRVALLDSTGSPVAHTVTDAAGQFQLEAPRPGVYRVQFVIYGWEPLTGPPDTLVQGSWNEKAYPLSFDKVVMLSDAPATGGQSSPQGGHDRYGRLLAILRSGESDSTWRSRESIPGNVGVRYPDRRLRTNDTGVVVARFIVDSTGLARPNSWRTLAATHRDYEDAVSRALLKSRWKPARLAGRPVCELVMDRTRFFRDSISRQHHIVFVTR